jgi:AraC-like DNA-binding protein
LRETGAPLVEIAEVLGFADVTAFVRAFRAWARCPPGQWREAAQRGTSVLKRPPATP